MTAVFDVLTCRGHPRELGRQHGEGARALVHEHLGRVRERLAELSPALDPIAAALEYRRPVLDTAPELDDEILGIADGAGISPGEAYLLQVRAEVATTAWRALAARRAAGGDDGAAAGDGDGAECTTFAIGPERTAGLGPIAGGNSDLPSMYHRLMVGLRLRPVSGPPILMATPAGQISYVGMNGEGLALFANSVQCDGWRRGFPRYLLSRLALRHSTVDDALGALAGVDRAASRNILLADRTGRHATLETTPELAPVVEGEDHLLVHANHFESPQGREIETAWPEWMADSRQRGDRLRQLLDRDPISIDDVQRALADRHGLPYALSREPNEDGTNTMTVVSNVARPDAGAIAVAAGPPHRTPYHELHVEAP
ncbi:MAG: C45 family peptidase [Actinomycetota bacterium]|nr:C45 family peptidase [Actinomycetota bacterium]